MAGWLEVDAATLCASSPAGPVIVVRPAVAEERLVAARIAYRTAVMVMVMVMMMMMMMMMMGEERIRDHRQTRQRDRETETELR